MTDTFSMTSTPPTGPMLSDRARLDGVSRPRLLLLLAIIVLFSEVVPLQYTLVAVAIPEIGRDFPAAGNQIAWVVTILGLVGGVTLPFLTKMSDLWGKKRMLLVGGAFFLAGSIICAITTSWPTFLVGRAMQSIAVSMYAIVIGLLRDLMPRNFVPIAVGVTGTGVGIAAVAAPVLAGVLTEHFSWRSVFWFLAIYVAVLFVPFLLMVPETALRVRQRLDVVGAFLLGAGIGLLLLYLSKGPEWGWTAITSWACLAGGVVLVGGFLLWAKRAGPRQSPAIG
jgi:MFS family permease